MKDTSIQISLCIPVYNVRPYLDELLKSIFAQELTAITYEILFIDDCSSDGSFEYLLEITKDIQNVRVLKNDKNSGISYTRNRLLDNARGEYIWFIDADDMLYPDSLRILLEIALKKRVDIVLANYIKVPEDACVPPKKDFGLIELKSVGTENYNWLPDKNNECRMLSVWRGIFKKDFFTINGLRFNEKVIMKEDALLYYEMSVCGGGKIIKCEFPCYCVRQRASSAMHGIDETKARKYFHSSLALVYTYLSFLDNKDLDVQMFSALIEAEKELLVKYLLHISDLKFVRESLTFLRQKGLYPYMTKRRGFKNVHNFVDRLLPMEAFFWLIYCVYRIKSYAK